MANDIVYGPSYYPGNHENESTKITHLGQGLVVDLVEYEVAMGARLVKEAMIITTISDNSVGWQEQ